jgi:hypothetical protein
MLLARSWCISPSLLLARPLLVKDLCDVKERARGLRRHVQDCPFDLTSFYLNGVVSLAHALPTNRSPATGLHLWDGHAGSSWGRVPRVIWLGLQDSPGMQELLRVQRVMDRACWAAELIHDQRPFCAHITLGKTKNTERMSTQQRRTLRGFGKWMQDQHRSLHLQQLLERDDPRAGGVGGGRSTKSLAPDVAQRRGRKRHKSWLAGGGGKKGGGVHGHVARQRDLGALNAELAAEAKVYADDNFIHPSIEVDALYVLESVKQEESNYRVYEILRCIPLAPTEREKDLQSRATGGNGDPATEAADRRGVANDETDTDTGISSQLSDESLSLSTPSSSLTSSERDSLAQLLEDLDQD